MRILKRVSHTNMVVTLAGKHFKYFLNYFKLFYTRALTRFLSFFSLLYIYVCIIRAQPQGVMHRFFGLDVLQLMWELQALVLDDLFIDSVLVLVMLS